MTSSYLIRWSGIAAMLGGVLWVVWSLLVRVSLQATAGPFSDGLLLSSRTCSRWPDWWGFMLYREATTGA